MKKWIINELISAEASQAFAELFRLSQPVADILFNRGYRDESEIEKFINQREYNLYNPFLIKDMQEAVDRFRYAIDHNEKIGIFSDSDLDGLTSLAAILKLLSRLNYSAAVRYPQTDEAYGLTFEIIDEFIEKNITLLITLDSGTRDIDEIAHASENGIDVIVIDHHEQGDLLPEAIVINPHRHDCTYPFKNLAGVGVAFKFITAFLYSYLGAYNKSFILIVDEEAVFHTLEFKNGIILSNKIHKSLNELKTFLNDIPSDIRKVFIDREGIPALSNNYTDAIFLREIIFRDNYPAINETLASLFSFNSKSVAAEKLFVNSIFYNSEKIHMFLDSILELVAIGTIADVVPLVDENRTLVYLGIRALNRCDHPGLKKLINGSTVNSKMIGWNIAPLLNTPGRLGQTALTASFFSEDKEEKIIEIIAELNELNAKRKNDLNEFFTEIMIKINTDKIEPYKNILAIKENIPEGLTGLLANRISDKTGRPVILFSLPGKNRIIKGSGRNTGSMEFFPHVSKSSHLFERIGGHANAFGFSIHEDNIDAAVQMIEESLSLCEIKEEYVSIDCVLDMNYITPDFIESIAILEPFGKDNPEPIFLTRNIIIDKFQTCGRESQHGRFSINTGTSRVSAIGWNMSDRMKDFFLSGEKLDIVYRLENNIFRDNIYPQMIIEDIGLSQS